MSERILEEGFHQRVFALVKKVPKGRVTTYGDVAIALGSVAVARHIGFALAALRNDEVPWQRVINSQGRISFPVDSEQYRRQKALLLAEGVVFDERDRVDLARLRWLFTS
jgi:methylated-DNA-protein-cysteine methyltransferase-like protein